MITQAESGLSESYYNQIRDSVHGVYSRLAVFKYSPEFTQIYDNSDGAASWVSFDAIIHNSKLVRVDSFANIVEVFDGTTWNEYSYTPPANSTYRISLATNGTTTLYLYQITSTGVSVATSSNDGATFGSWSEIITGTVSGIAAVAPSVLHYYTSDTNYNYQLKKYDTGTIYSSEIFLQRPPSSIAAIRNGSTDTVILCVDVPGMISAKYVNNQVRRYMYRSGGIIAFNVFNNSWSDHYDVDVLEKVTSYQYRRNVTASLVNGTLVVTSDSCSGSTDFPLQAIRFYTSKDGVYWSNGKLYYGIQGAYKLLLSGSTVYLVGKDKVYSSPATAYFGAEPTEVYSTIPQQTMEFQSGWSGMKSTSVLLADTNSAISDLDLDGLYEIRYYIGNGMTDETNQSLLVSREIIDAVETSHEVSGYDMDKYAKIVSRDFMSLTTDHNQSEQAKYWRSQLLGGDNYSDDTQTGYGGLSHTETVTGAWKTSNNSLQLYTGDKEGVCFTTFESSLWNGMIETSFNLSMLANNEFAGVVFRGIDKDNFWHARYEQADDRIHLYERRTAQDFERLSGSTLSWSGDLNRRWIKAVFHYADLKIYTSSDGITWSLYFSYKMWGVSEQESEEILISVIPFERGFTGLIAKGYVPQELQEWSYEPPPSIILPTLDPFDWSSWLTDWGDEFVYDPGSLMLEDPRPGNPLGENYGRIFNATKDGFVFKLEWNASGEVYTDISPTSAMRTELGDIVALVRDPYVLTKYVLKGTKRTAYTPDITQSTVNWLMADRIGIGTSGTGWGFEKNWNFSRGACGWTITTGSLGSGGIVPSGGHMTVSITGEDLPAGPKYLTMTYAAASSRTNVYREYSMYSGLDGSYVERLGDHYSGGWVDHTTYWMFTNATDSLLIQDYYSPTNDFVLKRVTLSTSTYDVPEAPTLDIPDAFATCQPVLGKQNMYVWLAKDDDGVYFMSTPDFFQSVVQTHIGTYDADCNYSITNNPHNWREFYVSSGTKVYKSIDAGVTFTEVPGITLSDKGGALWWNWATETVNVRNQQFANMFTVLGQTGGAIKIQQGTSASVSIVANTAKYNMYPLSIGANARDMSFVRYVAEDGTVYKSDDGGDTWAETTSSVTVGSGGYARGWWQYPADKNFMIVFGKKVLSYTIDSGTAFVELYAASYDTFRSTNYSTGGTDIVSSVVDTTRRYPLPVV